MKEVVEGEAKKTTEDNSETLSSFGCTFSLFISFATETDRAHIQNSDLLQRKEDEGMTQKPSIFEANG